MPMMERRRRSQSQKRPSDLRRERKERNKQARREARGLKPKLVHIDELAEPHPLMRSQSKPASGAPTPQSIVKARLKRDHDKRAEKRARREKEGS